jgi:hypothetical protein
VQQVDRITRFYLYSWRGDPAWDSGLIRFRSPRPKRTMYSCYRFKTNPQSGDRQTCLNENEVP